MRKIDREMQRKISQARKILKKNERRLRFAEGVRFATSNVPQRRF